MNASPAVADPARRPSAPVRLILFRLDGRRCAVAASAVAEILAAVATSPLPRQPAYIAGVIDLRGEIVPVLDLRVRFGLASRLMELTDQLIVVRAAGRALALWVDEVEEFAWSDPAGWSTPGGLIAGERSLAGVAALSGGLATIHDTAAFIAQCEADAVFEVAGT
jgi:purine-binding chemotaxis protein CheW